MESKGMENESETEYWSTTRTITTSDQAIWLLSAQISQDITLTHRQDYPRHPRWNQLTRISIFPIVRHGISCSPMTPAAASTHGGLWGFAPKSFLLSSYAQKRHKL